MPVRQAEDRRAGVAADGCLEVVRVSAGSSQPGPEENRMINDRPVHDPKLQKALDEVRQVMARYGLAGAVMLVSDQEAAFSYKMDAPWSALRYEPGLPLGFRFRAKSNEDGKEKTRSRVEGAMHTICQISDFGEQTTAWMEDMKLMLRRAGIDFEHTPFGGNPLEHLVPGPDAGPR
jgi:protein tyrosine phosphatase (PTP) superfamily phosphohydrolase (DUF442 family)